MANKKLSEGVGKKIVEALKKQSEIEITPSSSSSSQDDLDSLTDELTDAFNTDESASMDDFQEEDLIDNAQSDDFLENIAANSSDATFNSAQMNQQFVPIQPQQSVPSHDNFISELDNFEIPDNIAVLKKLITQLPSGVSRHTGAQIIKQTMEALGISMKSVLQEAQQVQDGLNNSAKECYTTIQEYKKQIMVLEKQAQNHQKQCAALNELISLFIQTGI